MDAHIAVKTVTDADTVFRVIDAVVPERVLPESGEAEDAQGFLDDPNTFLVGAFDGEDPVGLSWGVHILYPNGRRMTYLHHLEVVASHRDGGIGSALMDASFELARQHGSPKFWLSTGMHNTSAQRLYDRLGGTRKELGDVNYWWDVAEAASGD